MTYTIVVQSQVLYPQAALWLTVAFTLAYALAASLAVTGIQRTRNGLYLGALLISTGGYGAVIAAIFSNL